MPPQESQEQEWETKKKSSRQMEIQVNQYSNDLFIVVDELLVNVEVFNNRCTES